jgi:hypothetical protein
MIESNTMRAKSPSSVDAQLLRVVFTTQEAAKLEALAHLRSDGKQHWDVGNIWAEKCSPSFFRHLMGLRAEYAVAKLLGLGVDKVLRPRGDNNAPDLVLPDGRAVSVKGRSKVGYAYALRSTNPKEFGTGVGVLVWPERNGRDDAVDVVGWVSRREFIALAEIQDFTYGPRLTIEGYQMHPMPQLILEVNALRAFESLCL